jgi:hypothetical protein
VRAVDGRCALMERAARALDEAAPLDRLARAVQSRCVAVAPDALLQRPVFSPMIPPRKTPSFIAEGTQERQRILAEKCAQSV